MARYLIAFPSAEMGAAWVELLGRYPDPPDLFYGVRVVRIRHPGRPTDYGT